MATIVMSKGRHYHMPVQRRQENERRWPMSQETGGDNERRRPLVQETGGRWLLTQENGGSWPLGQKIGERWQSEDMAGGRWQHEQETEGSWLAGQEAGGMWQSGQDCRGRWHTGQENIGNQSSGQDIVGTWPTGQDSGTTWPSGDTSRMEEDSSPSSSSIGSADLYFSREEIDKCSPSRRDGIDAQKETYLRHSYCSFLQNLGMRLQLPQTTIATAMVLCHRFFLRRSHATYDRFIIATSCLFLAAKSEETPRPLNSVVLVSYEMCHKHDLANFHYRMPKDWFEQYKERVLEAEQLVLTTLDFELTVQHPYQPLVTFFEKIGLTETALVHVAWSLINDGLRSSLSLQFKSHHIAAGAAFLAARVLNVDLPSNGTLSWWQEFQTTPAILDSVVQQMLELYGRNGG